MKSIIFKQCILTAIILLAVLSGYSQQKVRTSERPFNKDVQKAKLQEQRNIMVRKMGNRKGLQDHTKPITPISATPSQINKPANTKLTGNQVKVERKPTLLN